MKIEIAINTANTCKIINTLFPCSDHAPSKLSILFDPTLNLDTPLEEAAKAVNKNVGIVNTNMYLIQNNKNPTNRLVASPLPIPTLNTFKSKIPTDIFMN